MTVDTLAPAVVSREDALRAAAEVYLDAKIRIETEKAIASASELPRTAVA